MKKLLTALTLVLVSNSALAANYAGVYMGGFSGPIDKGAFAGLIRTDNSAVVMAYDSIDDFGFINENISVSSSGAFSETNIDSYGTNVSGNVHSTAIAGTYNSYYSSGNFSGSKSNLIGPYSSQDGYYKGTFSTNCGLYGSGLGYFRAILSADGDIYAYIQYTQSSISLLPIGSKDGGILALSGTSIYGTTINGASVSGTANGKSIVGSFSFSGCTGSFSGALDYALNVKDTGVIAPILLLLQ
jgi:hypothetical protein